MTLIVKELIVRGIVSSDHSQVNETLFEREDLMQYLEQMKKEIERECTEKIMQKVESKTMR